MIKGIFAPKFWRTCPAVVGERPLNGLALGAASGNPQARITAWMNGWAGQRTPTVPPLAVTMSGISPDLGRTRVSGPGQKAAASLSAASGQRGTARRALP